MLSNFARTRDILLSIVLLSYLILACNPALSDSAQANILTSKASRLFALAKESEDLNQRAKLLREALTVIESIIQTYPDSLPALNFKENNSFAGLNPGYVKALLEITEREISELKSKPAKTGEKQVNQ